MINAEQYIPLVHKITKGIYKKFGFKYEYEDLFQVGCIGLMRAAKSFDESKGVKFTTYAYLRIKTSIFNSIRSDNWYVAKKCQDRFKEAYPPDSLDICLVDRGDTEKERLPYEESGYDAIDLKLTVNRLPWYLRRVLILRFFKELKIKEVEKILGISHGTVISRQRQALDFLRKELEA